MGLFEENVAKLKAMPQNGNWNQFAGYNAQELNAAFGYGNEAEWANALGNNGLEFGANGRAQAKAQATPMPKPTGLTGSASSAAPASQLYDPQNMPYYVRDPNPNNGAKSVESLRGLVSNPTGNWMDIAGYNLNDVEREYNTGSHADWMALLKRQGLSVNSNGIIVAGNMFNGNEGFWTPQGEYYQYTGVGTNANKVEGGPARPGEYVPSAQQAANEVRKWNGNEGYWNNAGQYIGVDPNGGTYAAPQPGTPAASPAAPMPGGPVAGGGLIGSATSNTTTSQGTSSGSTDPYTRGVDPATETIEGRVGSLLKVDANGNYTNSVVKQAAEAAMASFASRGLLNSSMAQEAAYQAAMSKAIEIAGPDAQTYFAQGRANQDAINVFRRSDQDFGHDMTKLNKELELRWAEMSQNDRQFYANLKARMDELQMSNSNQQLASEAALRNNLQLNNNKAVQDAYDLYMKRLTSIDADKDLDADAKIAAKNNAGKDFDGIAKYYGIMNNMDLGNRFKTRATNPDPEPGATTNAPSSTTLGSEFA